MKYRIELIVETDCVADFPPEFVYDYIGEVLAENGLSVVDCNVQEIENETDR